MAQGARVVLCDLPKSKGLEVAKGLGDEDKVVFAPVNVSPVCGPKCMSKRLQSFARLPKRTKFKTL